VRQGHGGDGGFSICLSCSSGSTRVSEGAAGLRRWRYLSLDGPRARPSFVSLLIKRYDRQQQCRICVIISSLLCPLGSSFFCDSFLFAGYPRLRESLTLINNILRHSRYT
jgi:hypothetical protein